MGEPVANRIVARLDRPSAHERLQVAGRKAEVDRIRSLGIAALRARSRLTFGGGQRRPCAELKEKIILLGRQDGLRWRR